MASELPSANPPPDYPHRETSHEHTIGAASPANIQILIAPAPDASQFQKGYLGADGERAAIEGELQIKGGNAVSWQKITVTLRSVETAQDRTVELSSSEVILHQHDVAPASSSSATAPAALPAALPFAVPFTSDTPQTIRTPFSSLTHTLTAVLYPFTTGAPEITQSIEVFPLRYTSHALLLEPAPHTVAAETPTSVRVEVPRTTFKAGETIPLYVIIPPPPRELVVDQGLRLRNIRVELVRTIRVTDGDGRDGAPLHDTAASMPSMAASSGKKAPLPPPSHGEDILDDPLRTYKTVVSRSGASCRFHTSRSIQLRFILHPPSASDTPSTFPFPSRASLLAASSSNAMAPSPPGPDHASITQSTVLHRVSFRALVHVAYVSMATHTEQIETITVPLVIIPPSAPLPEVEPSVDTAYRKKHDRPPTVTVRRADTEVQPFDYDESVTAGPGPSSAAPPPFEEREAPPPFSHVPAESSSAPARSATEDVVRLPTFLESETDHILVPPAPDGESIDDHEYDLLALPETRAASGIPGEGVLFGFSASEQFDGHAEEVTSASHSGRSSDPPPSLEAALDDPDVSSLAALGHAPDGRAIEALAIVLEQHDDDADDGPPPPPAPAMDDPSDPPPSIDSAFRTHGILPPGLEPPPHPDAPPPGPPPLTLPHESYASIPPPSPQEGFPQPPARSAPVAAHPGSHAPPPYLGDEEGEHAHTTGPPPYVG